MTAKLFSSRHDWVEAYRAYHAKHGCPIEDGSLGNLADHECEHGSLPGDRKRSCDCWPKRKAGKR